MRPLEGMNGKKTIKEAGVVGEVRGGRTRASGTDMYVHCSDSYGEAAARNREVSSTLCGDLEGWGGIVTCKHMAYWHHHSAKLTQNTAKQLYPNLKKKERKRHLWVGEKREESARK